MANSSNRPIKSSSTVCSTYFSKEYSIYQPKPRRPPERSMTNGARNFCRSELAGISILALETIAYSPDSLDKVSRFPQLLSQTNNLDINGPVCNKIIFTVSRIDHLITSIDPARISSEEVENPELRGSQRDLLAINQNKVSS